jgi:DNA uptake protein ComE-like DNA-binding protein
MEPQNNWKWLLSVPGVNWLGLLVAGQQVRKPSWVRWAILYAIISALTLGYGLLSGDWFWFVVCWIEIGVHSHWVQGEYRNRLALITNPRLRLTSARDLRLAGELGMAMDVNRASVDDLLRLPGMSIVEARRIVEGRKRGGPYLSAEELAERAEISAHKVRSVEPLLQFCYYETALPVAERLCVNDATAAELATVEGIYPSLAEQIVRERTARGDYADLAELRERLQLSARVTARLVSRLEF